MPLCSCDSKQRQKKHAWVEENERQKSTCFADKPQIFTITQIGIQLKLRILEPPYYCYISQSNWSRFIPSVSHSTAFCWLQHQTFPRGRHHLAGTSGLPRMHLYKTTRGHPGSSFPPIKFSHAKAIDTEVSGYIIGLIKQDQSFYNCFIIIGYKNIYI